MWRCCLHDFGADKDSGPGGRALNLKICPKKDSTICFCVLKAQTLRVTEAEENGYPKELLQHEYTLNHKWIVTRIVQSYELDEKLAYVHGFDAGISLLCEKARLSSPAIAEEVRELVKEMVEETARTLRSLSPNRKEIIFGLFLHQR